MTHRRSALTLVLFVTAAIFPRYEHVAAQADDKPIPLDHALLSGTERVDLHGDPLPKGAVGRLGTIRWRHDGEAWATAFSPNGKVLASATFDGLIHLWDTATGREIRRLRMADNEQGLYAPQASIGFFPDGRILYATDARGIVRYWNVLNGTQLQKFRGSTSNSPQERFPTSLSSDGKILAVGQTDFKLTIQGTVNLFDATTGKVLRKIEAAHGSVASLCFLPDGQLLAVLSVTAVKRGQTPIPELKLWDVTTGTLSQEINGHSWSRAIAVSQDGKLIATGNKDIVVLSEVATGRELGKLEATMDVVMSLAFTPDNKTLITASQDGKVRMWDLASRKVRMTLDAKMWMIRSMALSKDGTMVAAGTVFNTIRLWDAKTGKELAEDIRGHDARINSVAFSPDGTVLATGGDNHQICLWEPSKQNLLRQFDSPNSARVVAFSPDGKSLASVWPNSRVIRLWNVANGRPSKELKHEGLGCKCIAFSHDAAMLVSAHAGLWHSADQPCELRIWDSTTGECLHKSSGNSASMECLAFSPDGKTVAVGTGNGGIQLWDVVARRQLTTLSGHRHSVNSVAFSPDGKTLVSGSADRTVKRWDVGVSKELGTFFGHERAVMAVAISPDGRLIASAGGSVHFPTKTTGPQRIRIWERATGQEALRLHGDDSDVTSLAFHPNGKLLAAGLANTTALVWNVRDQRERTQDIEASWADLAQADAAKGYRAICSFVGMPEKTVLWLKDHLKAGHKAAGIPQWIADLDSDTFAVREAAYKELAKHLPEAGPPLREAILQKTSPEARRRIEALLAMDVGIIQDSELLRSVRGIQVLEYIGTPEAQGFSRASPTAIPRPGSRRKARHP